MKYYVSITEFLNRVVSVEAANEQEALAKVQKAHDDSKVVLDSNDYANCCIELEEDQDYCRTYDAMAHVYERID